MSVLITLRSEARLERQQHHVRSHVDDVRTTIDSTAKKITNDIPTITTNSDKIRKPANKPEITNSPNETNHNSSPHVTDHVNNNLETERGFEKNNSIQEIKEEEAWMKIHVEYRRRSPTEHLETLRQPQAWSAFNGWKNFSPALFNRSDTFARFLHRSAVLKVNAIVRTWRDICCQEECCKNRFCEDECCEKKVDKKIKDACEYQRKKHLKKELYALGEDVTQWLCGPKTDLVREAIVTVDSETSWRTYQKDLAKAWEENFEYVKQEMEEKLGNYGLSLSDLHDLEAVLAEAEREAARVEEMERLESKKDAIMDEQEQDENEGQDEDDDDDEFPHLYAGLQLPSLTPSDGNSLCEQNLISPSFYQLENAPLTPPLTPNMEISFSDSKTRADDKFGMFLIDYYIEDLTEERERYIEKKSFTFQPDYLNKPAEQKPYNLCAWKRHPVSNFILDCSPSASQKYPEIHITTPEGDLFILEEQLPGLDDDFKEYQLQRKYWGLSIDELIRRGCTFEQGLYQEVEKLWDSGWEPEHDYNESDDEEADKLASLESGKKFDILDMDSAASKDKIEDEFSQKIKYLEPGQRFDITNLDQTTKSYGNPELTLINALTDDLHRRQRFYQDCSDDQFWWAIHESKRPSARLPMHHRCSWKRHLLSDFLKDLPKLISQPFPEIRVTDPEGNLYFLEEQAPAVDSDFEEYVAERNAWQSRKEIALEENEDETEEEYCARLQHFARWETEFRQVDGMYALKGSEQEFTTSTPPLKIDTQTDLQEARDALEAFDSVVRECLVEVKQEFIQTQAERDSDFGEEKERKAENGEKVGTVRRLSETLVKMREKLEKEGMVRMKKGGATYVGQWVEGPYWVEMKGNLGQVWVAFGLGGED